MRAISALSREAGMSTRVCLAPTPLRSRVSISAIGSVIASPTALCYAGHVALEGQLPETEPAQREFAHVGARPAAQTAAVAQPDLEFRRLLFFRDLRCRRHVDPLRDALKGVPYR